MTTPDFSDAAGPEDDAPYGRRADGSAKAKPGPKGPRKAAAPRPRKTAGSKPATEIDYRPAIVGLAQLPIGVISMGSKLIRNEQKRAAVQMDALAAKIHLPGIAEAINDTAKTNAKIANALDKVVQAGPYGELIAAVSPLVLQCLVNHGQVAPNPTLGLYAPEDLVKVATAA